jgi:hypothetical protein
MSPERIAEAMAYVRAEVAKASPAEELFAAIQALLTFEPKHEPVETPAEPSAPVTEDAPATE